MVFGFLVYDSATKERFAQYYDKNEAHDQQKVARTLYILKRVEGELEFR